MGLSWSHILIVLVLFVLLFGRGKISELMGDVAQGIKSFKKGMAEDEEPAEAARRRPKVIEHKQAAPSPAAPRPPPAPRPRASRNRASLAAPAAGAGSSPSRLWPKSRPCSTSVGRSFSSSPSSRSSWSVPRTCRALMRTFGHYAGKLRRVAADFQRQFEDAMRETEIEEVQARRSRACAHETPASISRRRSTSR